MNARHARRRWRTLVLAATIALTLLAFASTASARSSQSTGRWESGDIHTHTWLTDGKNTQDEVLRQAFENYGLDYFANSEHGGSYSTTPIGTSFVSPVWRWMTLANYSFPIILDARSTYPEKQIIQGV